MGFKIQKRKYRSFTEAVRMLYNWDFEDVKDILSDVIKMDRERLKHVIGAFCVENINVIYSYDTFDPAKVSSENLQKDRWYNFTYLNEPLPDAWLNTIERMAKEDVSTKFRIPPPLSNSEVSTIDLTTESA